MTNIANTAITARAVGTQSLRPANPDRVFHSVPFVFRKCTVYAPKVFRKSTAGALLSATKRNKAEHNGTQETKSGGFRAPLGRVRAPVQA